MVTIRRAAVDDLEAVADVYLASRRAAYPAIPPSVHSDEDVRNWVTGPLAAASELWVAVGPDRPVVAMMALREGWLDQLYVDPAYSRSGIGSALVEVAKAEHPSGLQLWTFESNRAARRFYESHGFVEAERTDGRRNEERAPDIRFVWSPALRRERHRRSARPGG